MGLFENLFNSKMITPEERRERSNKKIKKLGIACMEQLPMLESSDEVKLKSLDEMCKRAIACLLAIQVACDINSGNDYEESKEIISELLKKYNVEDSMIAKEKSLFDNEFTTQDVVDVAWTYEAYWSVVWALGLINDIEMPDDICDCQKAITLVIQCESFDEFKAKCHLRSTEKILDMLDLYYRYHWACEEKRIHPETPIGPLSPEVVAERRRGLE